MTTLQDGRNYHFGCFRCQGCHETFGAGGYVEKGGSVWHQQVRPFPL